MPWFDHFLDSRAEICQIFRGSFGKSKISKGHSEIIWPLEYVKFQSWTDFNPASCLILSGYALVKNLAFCRLLTAQTYFFNIFFNNFSTYSKVCTYYFSIPYLRLKKISAWKLVEFYRISLGRISLSKKPFILRKKNYLSAFLINLLLVDFTELNSKNFYILKTRSKLLRSWSSLS